LGVKRTTTVLSPSASAASMSRNSIAMLGWPFSFRIDSENATSAAVIGLPSWNLMPLRSRNL
jgi:hypothetical protein